MSPRKVPGLPGWTDLGSDINWPDYHGTWGRKAPDGSWYVLTFTNMVDACGEECADKPYLCDVKRLLLADLNCRDIDNALKSYGWSVAWSSGVIHTGNGGEITSPDSEAALIECCIRYVFGAPLESFAGRVHAARVRADARRYAEACMRDESALQTALDRPVNAIGLTAREYGVGDLASALARR